MSMEKPPIRIDRGHVCSVFRSDGTGLPVRVAIPALVEEAFFESLSLYEGVRFFIAQFCDAYA